MISKHIIDNILDQALSTGGDFAEVFAESSVNTSISLSGNNVENGIVGRDFGVGIRIFNGLNSVYAFTNDASYDNLMKVTKQISSTLKSDNNIARKNLEKLQNVNYHNVKISPKNVEYKNKLDMMKKVVSSGLEYDKCIRQMLVRYLDIEQNVLIANSEGRFVEDNRIKTRLMVNAYAQNTEGIESGYVGPGSAKGYEFYDELNVDEYAIEAARVAKTMLNAKYAPSGNMSVVIDNGFGGLLFHEACGHSLEASSVAKGNSEFSGKIGKKIASNKVTLIDDGSIKNAWGSLGVDDEGELTRKNILIEKGILKSYMIDKLNARRMNMDSTGSARRESYRFAPTSRMSNTYIANGESTREEIISNTENGLFVKMISAGSVNPITGEFNFSTSEAYLIENGRITEPVKGATLIGNGESILKQVDMVGNNLKIDQGYCFAGSGALFIGAGQPTVRVANMTVGGVKND
ncbi:MAG: TldD/PmbA family protein [Romboutsia sp.]